MPTSVVSMQFPRNPRRADFFKIGDRVIRFDAIAWIDLKSKGQRPWTEWKELHPGENSDTWRAEDCVSIHYKSTSEEGQIIEHYFDKQAAALREFFTPLPGMFQSLILDLDASYATQQELLTELEAQRAEGRVMDQHQKIMDAAEYGILDPETAEEYGVTLDNAGDTPPNTQNTLLSE